MAQVVRNGISLHDAETWIDSVLENKQVFQIRDNVALGAAPFRSWCAQQNFHVGFRFNVTFLFPSALGAPWGSLRFTEVAGGTWWQVDYDITSGNPFNHSLNPI